MYAVPADVSTHLGRPPFSPEEDAQVAKWIGWLEADIARRISGAIDSATANRVITESIAAYMRHPDSATQVDVAVDDGRVSKRYSTASGRVQILPDLWADLGWVETGAFTVTPHGALDATSVDLIPFGYSPPYYTPEP